ncbi:chymase [Drosophila mojavensis]|uniref:Peptidase S1 domain-containing protein n=1 Tax=Drosophila mojavensis TaxID=7230 RepID=B4KWG6_DROMO|nr:chymase [Drosophila mojavensis]EDW19595.1 uncharacterized protein Dmoj_GI11437 [Drosophila mojavensis]
MHLQIALICSLIALGVSTYYLPHDHDETAEPSSHPQARYIVSIQTKLPRSRYFGTNHVCVGTIVAPIFVLTTTHCIYNRSRVMHPDELLIIAGAPNRQKPTEHSRLMHVQSVYPRASSGIIHNLDLALLRIRDQDTLELNLTLNLGIASLATLQSSGYLRCTRFGWERAETNESRAGVLSPRTLQLQPQKFCLSLFPGFYRTHWLCATALPSASQNVCGGDPGGPLFCGGHLAGIYMRAVAAILPYSCPSPRTMTGYRRPSREPRRLYHTFYGLV